MVILFSSFKCVRAQTTGIQEARDISRRAQDLIEQEKWEEAIELLRRGLRTCGEEEQRKECRALLNFSLGYLYQQKITGDRMINLERSVEYYRQALVDLSNNVEIMNNLAIVLKLRGNWEEAARVLKRVTEIDIENRDTYLIALGDLYRENDLFQEALKSYQKASELNPLDDAPHWRILSLYRRLKDENLPDLFHYSVHLDEINKTELAKDGFEQVINRSFRLNESLAERALILWVELGAGQGWIAKESIKFLPDEEEWRSPAIKELRSLVIDPISSGSHLNWWRADDFRRHVAASVLKSMGSNFMVDGEFKHSAKVYELALRIAPMYYFYRGKMKSKSHVALNISLELASLYYRYPALDPEGRKFRSFLYDLFDQKTGAYHSNDLAAIQRLHTVLGLIYAEKGQWTSSWRPGNAVFQLEHALRTAQKRLQENHNNYQPLPHLQSLLAKGYVKVDNRKGALITYLDAAMGYLDLDILDKVAEMLEAAVSLPYVHGSSEKWRLTGLKNILNTRQQISQLQRDNLNLASPNFFGKSEQFNWLFDPAALQLEKSFVNRQRFKAFSDLGNRASLLKVTPEDLYFYTQAMEIIRSENILSSMDDIVRLEQIKTTVIQNISISKPKQIIGTGHYLEKSYNYSKGKIWWLALPSEQYPTQIGMSQDLLLAGTIENRISKESSLASEEIMLHVQDGQVMILQELSSFEVTEKAVELIKEIEGVQQVKIKEKIE